MGDSRKAVAQSVQMCKTFLSEKDKNMRTRTSGQGRAKGVPNKVTGDLRAMISGALHELGGQAYLVRQAKENPTAFMALLAKILPREIKAEVCTMTTIQRLTPEQLNGIAEAALFENKSAR